MLSQFGLVGQLAQGGLGIKNPQEMYVALLQSHSVSDRIIKRFDLSKVYGEETLVETRKELERHTYVDLGKGGSIVIEVDDKDPREPLTSPMRTWRSWKLWPCGCP